MVKILAETVGDFMYWNPNTGATLEAHRPGVIEREHGVEAKIGLGSIRVLGVVNDDQTDESFVAYMQAAQRPGEGKKRKAVAVLIEAYLKEHAVVEDGQKAMEPEDPPVDQTEQTEQALGVVATTSPV